MCAFFDRILCAVLIAVFLSGGCAVAAEEHDKVPVPAAAGLANTTKLVQGIYAKEIKHARTREDKIVLAETLLADALKTKDDATGRYALLQIARDLAADNGDIDAALRAIDLTAQDYDIDVLAVKYEVINSLAGAVRDRSGHRKLFATINETITEAIAADRYDLAKKLSTLALNSARKAPDIAVVRQAVSQIGDVEAVEKAYAGITPALAKLKTAPADPDANLAVGRFVCFVKGDWDSGITMLALGSNVPLKELAEKELTMPSKADEQISLGDAWWSFSESQEGIIKRNLSLRAQYWYKQVLPQLSGLTAARVQKRLEENMQSTAEPVGLPAGTVVAFDFEKGSLKQSNGKKVLQDISNNGGDAEIKNGALVRGVHGTAISFDPGGFAKFSDKALPNGDLPRTILFWFRLNKSGDTQFPFAYGGRGNEGDATYLLVFFAAEIQGRGSKMSVGNPGGVGEPTGKSTIADGRWHHAGLVYDGNGTVQLFIDGQQDLGFSRRYHTTSGGDAFIGIFAPGSPSINGAIDDFIILDRMVSVDEINAIKDRALMASKSK